MGTGGGFGQIVIFPSPNVGLPNPAFTTVGPLPPGTFPHGVSYYGTDNALVADANNSRVFVIQVSTATLLGTISTSPCYNGFGTIAVAPGSTFAFASGVSANLCVISAPFGPGSVITPVALPGTIAGFQAQAIVFNAAGRAFVLHDAGISVLDPPYAAIAFTIPIAGAFGAIAITPDGNTLLATDANTGTVRIFSAPFSAASSPANLVIAGATGLNGILATPDGTQALVVSFNTPNLRVISAPYGSSSTVDTIVLDPVYDHHEDIGISPDGQLAILAGGGGSNVHTAFVRAPFTAAGATVFDVTIQSGRGAGAVRFNPSGGGLPTPTPTGTVTATPTATTTTTPTVTLAPGAPVNVPTLSSPTLALLAAALAIAALLLISRRP